MQNLRTDDATRSAINEIQGLLFNPEASEQIFELVLGFFKSFTNSDFAVCYVSKTDASAEILPNTALQSIYVDSNAPFINEKVLQSWVGQQSVLTTPVYYNHPIAPASRKVLLPDVTVAGLMMLPIRVHSELRAICILAKQQGEYEAQFIHKLNPLLGSVMATIQSGESVKGNFLGLDGTLGTSRYLSSLMSSSPVGVIIVDSNGTIVVSNPNAQSILNEAKSHSGLSTNKSIIGFDVKRFFPKYETLFQWSFQEPKFDSPTAETLPRLWEEQQIFKTNGEECSATLTIFRYEANGERFTTLQFQDVTSTQKSAEKYKLASQQLNALTQLLPVAIIQVDKNWECHFANDKWFEFSGLTSEESYGKEWINAIHPSDIDDLLNLLFNSLQVGEDLQKEFRIVTPLGATKWIDFNSRVLFDQNDKIEGFLGTFADVTERHLSQQKLKYVAQYDGLTGLANKMLFEDRLSQSFIASERDDSVISLFFLDLDGFKDVNDTLGHDVGDLLLQKVSGRLLHTLRRNDTVARFGGDEFVILLGQSETLAEVLVVAEKIITSVAKPYIIEDHEVYITTSLGISQGTYANSSARTLLKNADVALYNAKKEGKNKYQLFDDVLAIDVRKRIDLLNQLRTALKRKRYHMHYQPICDLQNGKVIGFESLIRFVDNQERIIGPDRFISLLEESSMILDVGRWVIEQTCRQLSVWMRNDDFPELGYLAFNVSAKQLSEENFVGNIKACCERFHVPPANLVMEITESVIFNKPENVKSILNDIRALGIRIALDDFGTGYSSLSYLQNYPFDILKIDKSFIDDLSANSNDTKITKAIIALGNSLELKICAEGVENIEALQAVKNWGVQVYQGYYLSKPLPAFEVIPFLQSRTRLLEKQSLD
jgi:diguanylate cyclase (GGDEF)-like protein/PAS domain S-box-containing protein